MVDPIVTVVLSDGVVLSVAVDDVELGVSLYVSRGGVALDGAKVPAREVRNVSKLIK